MNNPLFINTLIKETGDVVTGKTPLTAIPENYGTDYEFVTPNELHAGFMVTKSEKGLSELGFKSIKSNTISGISVLVGCIGWDMGNVSMCFDKCATNQQINAITNFREGYNPYYVYYWLTTKKDYLFQIASVTRTPILNKTTFEDVSIPIPERSVQDDIVSVLSTIDQKILLNNRIIDELEAMAKTIHDYWFVQFDFPNTEGKPYRSSGGEMVWNEQLGRSIPKGWEVSKLSTLGEFKNGINYDKDAPQEQTVKIINVRDISSSSSILLRETLDSIALPIRDVRNYFVEQNDILIARSGIPGATRIMPPDTINTIYCGFIIRYRVIDIKMKTYLYYLLKRIEQTSLTKAGGTILKNINQDILKDLVAVIPDELSLDSFLIKVEPIFQLMFSKCKENLELIKLRDWLLPMLMNGQVTLK
jgi:type I restriction enzyme, S subunit